MNGPELHFFITPGNLHKLSVTAYLLYFGKETFRSSHTHTYKYESILWNKSIANAIAKQMYAIWISSKKSGYLQKSFSTSLYGSVSPFFFVSLYLHVLPTVCLPWQFFRADISLYLVFMSQFCSFDALLFPHQTRWFEVFECNLIRN